MKKRILLYGVGTFKNRGVEAIINSTLKEIDFNKYEVTIASHDYDYNKNLYTDIKHIKHYYKSEELTKEEKKKENHFKEIMFDYHNFEQLYQKDVIKEIENSDICISVGGDNYCYPHCTWLYTLDEYAHKHGKKTILWGASLFDEIQDDELINDLNNFDILVIRESLSYNAVKKFVPENRILYAPDPAFSLEPKAVKLNSWYKGRKIIAINVSPLTIQNLDQEKAVYNLIDYILKETKYSLLLLPHVTTEDCNDLEILNKIKEKYKDNERVYLEAESYNCNELKYIISKCNILIAARTHASIAAYSTCVPTLVIGYSVKSRGIAKDLFEDEDKYVISKEKLTSENLKDKFLYIEKNQKKIKEHLEKIIPSIKEQSANLFDTLLKKINEQEQLEICSRGKCIGCGVCMKKCPQDAITMEKDNNGFIISKINLEKCIHCDICRKGCPMNQKENENTFNPKCYAAINLNKEEQEQSTSGGIFSLLAHSILNKKGVVYGSYMKDFKAKHIRVTKEQDLDKIRGSKYIQSDISNIFTQLKEDVLSKKEVLFCGTPCQVGAIKSFLGKEYDNLILVSVVCHGVINEDLFHKYLKELEIEHGSAVIDFKFRTKDNNWTQSSIKYMLNNNKSIIKPFTDDPFMMLYLKNYILRDSCYDCQYKGKNNVDDIILGDFWGIEVTNPEMLDQKGVSALIINSKKGEKYMKQNSIIKKTKSQEIDIENLIKYNPALVESVSMPIDRKKVLNDLKYNSAKMITNYYIKEKELEKHLEEKNQKVQGLIEENTKIATELSTIINSRRWKIVDKGINKINRLLGRK